MEKEFKIHMLKAHKELLEAVKYPLDFVLKRLEQRIKELEKSVVEEMKVEEERPEKEEKPEKAVKKAETGRRKRGGK